MFERYLTARPGANGVRYFWQPSTMLRAQGWGQIRLSDDAAEAVRQAHARNLELEAWRREQRDVPIDRRQAPAALNVPRSSPPAPTRPIIFQSKHNFDTGIYVIGSTDRYLKIGIAQNPATRLKQLQTSNAKKLELYFFAIGSWFSAHVAERIAHQLLADRRREGEWFAVSPNRALAAVVTAIRKAAHE